MFRIIVILKFICILNCLCDKNFLLVDFNEVSGELKHFWRSTGQCPPAPRNASNEFLLSTDNKINIALISALPHKSIQYIRVHWLLDLLQVKSKLKNHKVKQAIDFTYLDEFIDWNYQHGMFLIFELMGNPNNIFNNFRSKRQIKLYKWLLGNIIQRYIVKYGENYVSAWMFETWNEPDLNNYNILNFTFPAYLNYVKATKEVLSNKKLNLRLSGPAGLFKTKEKHPLCWGIMDFCSKYKCPFDFISFHAKGNESSSSLMERELEIINSFKILYKKFDKMLLINDEADVVKGWSTSKEWRGDVRYAAMVLKTIIDHQSILISNNSYNIKLISNDNAFINYHPFYFTQRTLLTRFQMNNTKPAHIQLIKKPVYTTMGLLSFLGTSNLQVIKNCTAYISTLAGLDTNINYFSFGFIILYSNETVTNADTINVNARVINIPLYTKRKYVIYTLNDVKTNPYLVWRNFGSPVFPNRTVLNTMRSAEGPKIVERSTNLFPSVTDINFSLVFTSMPSITLIHLCGGDIREPTQVIGVEIFNVTFNQILIIWNDERIVTKCIKTFEIEFSNDNEQFTKINEEDVIFLSFYYNPNISDENVENTIGWYRIRAVDYWNRSGPYSVSKRYSKM